MTNDYVTILGPKDILEKIDYIDTELVRLNNEWGQMIWIGKDNKLVEKVVFNFINKKHKNLNTI